MLRLNSAKKPPLCHPERSEGSPRFFVVPPLAGLLRMTFQIVISGCGLAHKIKFTLPFQCICCLFLLVSLVSCGKPELKKNSPDEVLLAPGFRLVDSPQEIVPWRYYYLNRVFWLQTCGLPPGNCALALLLPESSLFRPFLSNPAGNTAPGVALSGNSHPPLFYGPECENLLQNRRYATKPPLPSHKPGGYSNDEDLAGRSNTSAGNLLWQRGFYA
jgi:hypothetical protein